jgi:hypothetical protein
VVKVTSRENKRFLCISLYNITLRLSHVIEHLKIQACCNTGRVSF